MVITRGTPEASCSLAALHDIHLLHIEAIHWLNSLWGIYLWILSVDNMIFISFVWCEHGGLLCDGTYISRMVPTWFTCLYHVW